MRAFDLADDDAWQRWRERKLREYPKCAKDLIVEVANPRHLGAAERMALVDRCRRANMAIYVSRVRDADKDIPRTLGRRERAIQDSSRTLDELGTRTERVAEMVRLIKDHCRPDRPDGT